jgi:cytosine/adenosine deaminase-related metal-dependent hydrolase
MSTPPRRWFPLAGPDAGSKAPVAARAAPGPIGPLDGPRLALSGRVVTMDDTFQVFDQGVVYVERGAIVDVRERSAPCPPGFESMRITATGGTIYPGLIELHNHLSYNALPLWAVPRRFEHRGQWPDHPDYRKLISGPMTVVGRYRDAAGQAALLAPLVRYVECKCLLGGVTTTQGVMLNSNAGIQRFYRGIVRNVEQTDDPDLAEAQGRIADVDAKDARSFLSRLAKEDSCFLLHLSEGVTPDGQTSSIARRHFLALQVAPDEWALNDRFAGIHAAGLLPEDNEVLGRHGGAMIWSPLSNLLLYGATARVDAARAAGLPGLA